MKPGIQKLQSVPIFATLGITVLEQLNEIADLWRVGPDEVLIRQGETQGEFMLLLSGYALSTQAHPRSGEEAPIDLLAPIAALQLSSALLELPALLGVRTVTTAQLVVLPAAEFRAMLRVEESLARCVLDHALLGVQALTREVCELKLRTTAQRLAAFLLNLITDPELKPARFVLPFEKRFIAARLGCSQENLSRALARLRAFGVDARGGVVVMPDVPALQEFAGNANTPAVGGSPDKSHGGKA
jgi:CRP-like cAMP-binding protein